MQEITKELWEAHRAISKLTIDSAVISWAYQLA